MPKTSATTKAAKSASPSSRSASSPYPHLPLIAGTPPNVTDKVGACFRAGHTGVWSSQPAGAYEIFGTTGPGGGRIEIVATHSAAVAAKVERSIAASGGYEVIGSAGKRSVAAVSKGSGVADQVLAIRCAALAG